MWWRRNRDFLGVGGGLKGGMVDIWVRVPLPLALEKGEAISECVVQTGRVFCCTDIGCGRAVVFAVKRANLGQATRDTD